MKKIKSIIALLMVVTMYSSCFCIDTFAAEVPSIEAVEETEIQPRVGYAYHGKFSLRGGPGDQYELGFKPANIPFPYQQWSVKTSGFSEDMETTCYIVNSNFNKISSVETMRHDQELKNLRLTENFVAGEQYYLIVKIRLKSTGEAYDGPAGTIEFWVF